MATFPSIVGLGEPFVSKFAGDVPKRARVIVIGGGIAGCSVAYHLGKKGWRDVIVLEQGVLAGGTTWHAAGQVGRMRVSSSMAKINQISASLYASLKEESGHDPLWRQVGSLMMARNEQRLTQFRRTAGMAEFLGIESHEISPKETLEKFPYARIDDLIASIWVPHDGIVNPAQCAIALAKAAEKHGARIVQGIRVTKLLHAHGRATGVSTEHGDILADMVVLCGGMWTRQFALDAGVNLPLWPLEHHYIVSKPLGRDVTDLPMGRDFDASIYFRGTQDRIVLGAFQYRMKPWRVPRVPDDFRVKLLTDDWDHFADPLEQGIYRMPILGEVGFEKFVNGPESFTPDNNFLLGETPELDGLFVSAGFNSAGIACSGGAGWALAEWMETGEQPFDLWSVDVRRFSSAFNNRAFLMERVTETPGLHYRMAWPNYEFETGRDVRRSPLHDRLAAAGACFQQKMLMERPAWFARPGQAPVMEYAFGRQNWFDNHRAEHMACREAAAIFDQSSFSKFVFRGPDALVVLQRLCGNDIDVPVGRIVYTGMFNRRGTFESDLSVARVGLDEFYLITGSAQAVRDAHWIRRNMKPGERAELVDVGSGWSVLGLMGPRSREILQSLTPTDLSNEAFPFGAIRTIEVGKATCRAARITYVGELGYELHVPADQATLLYDLVFEAGRPLGLVNAGHYAINSLRLEKGYRAFGADLTPDETPLEAGLGFVVAIDKPGGFLGRDALLVQRSAGVKKRMMSFVLEDPKPVLWGGERIFRDGRCVGSTTSGSYGHAVGGAVALGYVKNGGDVIVESELLTGRYEIDIAGTRVPARASLKPPYDPERKRLK
jgi:sarcosine dehydrogenase